MFACAGNKEWQGQRWGSADENCVRDLFSAMSKLGSAKAAMDLMRMNLGAMSHSSIREHDQKRGPVESGWLGFSVEGAVKFYMTESQRIKEAEGDVEHTPAVECPHG